MEEDMIGEDIMGERFALSLERIEMMRTEESVSEPYRSYFRKIADFVLMIAQLYEDCGRKKYETADMSLLQQLNDKLYEDILPAQYEMSYANPTFAVQELGTEHGMLLSFLYAEIRGEIAAAYENRMADITILNETLIQIYNLYEEGIPEAAAVKDVLYWFISDYCDQTLTYRIRESLDATITFATDIIMEADLTDLRYLYRFGEYISEAELLLADFMNSLPQETIELMADTYTVGYRRGFESVGLDLSIKRTVQIRYELGFERMIRRAIENFRAMGLEPIISRAAVSSMNRNPNRKVGYYATSPNKQYDYDHRYDNALYLDKAFKNRKLEVLQVAYETYKKIGREYAGPALVETFGEPVFEPVNKSEAWKLSREQEQLMISYNGESTQIVNRYVPKNETSFTIIAFPRPEIGPDFKEIFKETIRINTLDYEKYEQIQQTIIDALDQAAYVTITGKNGNKTNLKVALPPILDSNKQTNFENCVADVNIPLGEVFTSPKLEGTTGLLHVSSVYIGDIRFKNLRMHFLDGMVVEYSCENFDEEKQNQELVKQVIMKNHETLPMGEFAIGTNTTAYAMAQQFGIIDKLPILIVEKMGPHFAVGDTCFSWSEDVPIYNPDGKEIAARDNELSILRKQDVSKAYFSCHTDITIPYAELDQIAAVHKDGRQELIIADGKFALSGTEELNKVL